jgi:hypothetical protein
MEEPGFEPAGPRKQEPLFRRAFFDRFGLQTASLRPERDRGFGISRASESSVRARVRELDAKAAADPRTIAHLPLFGIPFAGRSSLVHSAAWRSSGPSVRQSAATERRPAQARRRQRGEVQPTRIARDRHRARCNGGRGSSGRAVAAQRQPRPLYQLREPARSRGARAPGGVRSERSAVRDIADRARLSRHCAARSGGAVSGDRRLAIGCCAHLRGQIPDCPFLVRRNRPIYKLLERRDDFLLHRTKTER